MIVLTIRGDIEALHEVLNFELSRRRLDFYFNTFRKHLPKKQNVMLKNEKARGYL